MKGLLAIALAFTLAACLPASEPTLDPPAATLTATEHETFVTYRLQVDEPVDRAFLRFVGEDLRANASECELVAGALECTIGAVREAFEVSVAGRIMNDPLLPYGVVCRRDDCRAVFVADD